jgi:hypothetical protein
LNTVRDAFITGTNPTLDTVKLGDASTNLSRGNTDIQGTELATGSVSNTDVSVSDTVTFDFDVSQDTGDVREIGLFTSTDTLFARLTTDTPIPVDDVTVTIKVENDPEVTRGVFTAAGLTLIRDIIANNSPSERNSYAFGSSAQAVDPADTDLISETTEFDTGSISFVNATGEAELQAIGPDLSGDVTLEYKNGGLTRNRTGGWIELPDEALIEQFGDVVSGNHSNGTAYKIGDPPRGSGEIIVEATLPYAAEKWLFDWQGDEFAPSNEAEDANVVQPDGSIEFVAGQPELITSIEDLGFNFQPYDTTYRDSTYGEDGDEFGEELNQEIHGSSFGFFGGDTDASTPRQSVIRGVRLNDPEDVGQGNFLDEGEVAQGGWRVDGVHFFDFNFPGQGPGTFDPQTNTYPGPSLYGGTNVVTFDTFTSPRTTDTITVQSTWNNVSNGQYLEVTDGNGETIRANNTANHVFEFAQESDTFTLSIFLDEYAGDPTTTPSEYGDAQKITSLSVSSGLVPYKAEDVGAISTRALLEANTIDGTTVAEGGIKANLGGTQLTRVRYAEFDVLANQRLVGNEIITIKNSAVG